MCNCAVNWCNKLRFLHLWVIVAYNKSIITLIMIGVKIVLFGLGLALIAGYAVSILRHQCRPNSHQCPRHFILLTPTCCHMGTAVVHSVPDRVEPSFVIFDILALLRSGLSFTVPGCKNYK